MKEQPDLKAVTIPWARGTYFGPVSNGVPDNMGKWIHPENMSTLVNSETVKDMAKVRTPLQMAQKLSASSKTVYLIDGDT